MRHLVVVAQGFSPAIAALKGCATAASRIALAACFLTTAVGVTSQSQTGDRERAYRANNLGVALLEQFKFDGAAAAFREALRIAPDLALARVNLSIALLYIPDLAGAAREASEAARLLPSSPQPPYVLGLLARADNRDADAVAFFERVRQIDSRDPGAAINLGQIYLQDRRYPDAIAVLRPVVADEPYNITAAYNLGLALTRAGQRDEGLRMMELSQTLRATGYGVTLSNSYLEQGRYAEAIASTGAEADLVDPAAPAFAFTAAQIRAAATTGGASPFGRRFSLADLTEDGIRRIASGLGGAVALLDFDGDGDLDLFVAAAGGQRLYRNDSGTFVDVTERSGVASVPAGTVPIGCVAGDVDNDGAPDLFVLRYGVSSLYRNAGNGRFSDVTGTARLAPYAFLPGAAALVDMDHDGDLDLVIAGLADVEASRTLAAATLAFPRDFAPAPLRLERNNGDGTFTDITRAAGLEAAGHAIAIVPTDFDNRRDVDLLIVYRDRAPRLLKNLRNGTFRDVASEVGLAGLAADGDEVTSVAAGDVNKDDYPDFFFGRAAGAGVLASSDGRGRFVLSPAPDAPGGALAARLLDYDDDGLLDLMTWSAAGPRMFRRVGAAWSDVTTAALAGPRAPAPASARSVATADLDGNGRTDAIAQSADGALTIWRYGGDSPHAFVRVQLKGRVSNRSGVGTKVQIRAGSLSQRLETSAATPAVASADVVFGLGSRPGADVVRVLWPSGVLQAEYALSSAGANDPLIAGVVPAEAGPHVLPATVAIEELDRKPSSCPFLYTWNGERFEFITDFMGGGEMGYWEGPVIRNTPDPIELVRIRGDQLRARDGRYDLRVTNELEETVFVDRLQLWSVAHPADIEMFPNEGMTDPPKPLRLYAVKDPQVPWRATDEHGHDVTARLARVDRQYPDDFAVMNIRGYAAEHTLTLDVGTGPAVVGTGPALDRKRDLSPLLLLTGWTDYAFSSDNVAAHQAGLALAPPSLQVKDADGVWRTRIADIGIPVGRPQTMVVDLAPVLRAGEHELRIVTNMRIYWDQVLVATSVPDAPMRIARVDPAAADLRARGFSIELKPDGRVPVTYEYDRLTGQSAWKTMTGRYTRVGDVKPLLARADDMFVIAKPGDEIALSFDASSDRALPAGWTRTFLLLADGYSKEMDINSASPDRVEPLPFHRMTRYPYPPAEHYPATRAHEAYRARYNTRVVVRD